MRNGGQLKDPLPDERTHLLSPLVTALGVHRAGAHGNACRQAWRGPLRLRRLDQPKLLRHLRRTGYG